MEFGWNALVQPYHISANQIYALPLIWLKWLGFLNIAIYAQIRLFDQCNDLEAIIGFRMRIYWD